MLSNFKFLPEQASTFAKEVDAIYFYLIGVSTFFSVLIFALVLYFAIRYKRKSEDDTPEHIHGNLTLEIIWTVIPFLIVMTFFFWGASLFFRMYSPPKEAMEFFVTGKQWMWKIQHPQGVREINKLHIPINTPIKLKMTSEDVIHSFFVPAFRVKMDVVPGRYTIAWFEATKPGEYHLFCAEYCGTKHSEMIGTVVAMQPNDYENWLAERSGNSLPMASRGESLFTQYRCQTCHNPNSGALGPHLDGIFGKEETLTDGSKIQVDENYLRDSILEPQKHVVSGYSPLMPSFKSQLSEDEVFEIIEYLKSK